MHPSMTPTYFSSQQTNNPNISKSKRDTLNSARLPRGEFLQYSQNESASIRDQRYLNMAAGKTAYRRESVLLNTSQQKVESDIAKNIEEFK